MYELDAIGVTKNNAISSVKSEIEDLLKMNDGLMDRALFGGLMSKTKPKVKNKSVELPDEGEFNLNFGYTTDLLEVPENPDDVYRYCEQCARWINQEMEKDETSWDVRHLVTVMGRIAAYLKMLRELDDALDYIETALALIEQYDLGPQQFIAQSLRWADILRYRGEFGEAEEVFDSVLEICQKVPEAKFYEDVALQHLGKLNFDLAEYDLALEFFEKALKLRRVKNDQSLIDSSEMAIEATKLKISEEA